MDGHGYPSAACSQAQEMAALSEHRRMVPTEECSPLRPCVVSTWTSMPARWSDSDQDLASKYQVHANDVFVSRSNTRGLVGLSSIAVDPVPPRTIYPDLLIKLQPDTSRVVPRFLAFILRCPSVRRQIQDRATGTSQSMVKISGSRLREVMIPLPSRKEQSRVVATFDEALDVSNHLLGGLQLPADEPMREAVLRHAFAGSLRSK